MDNKQIIIGTSGHIDHGKTALIKAMTGTDADRWEEEKARGITIDIGFAHIENDQMALSFIDVPGHKDFVKNMLTGIHSIDLGLLIVAADESVMPQTKEHFSILSMLGIQQVIPVITKCDLADEDMQELTELEIREMFENSRIPMPERFFRVSSFTGQGIDDLMQALFEAGRKIENFADEQPPYLPVDRSFTIKGHGTVVTGTLMSGRLELNDKIYSSPLSLESIIKNLSNHNEEKQGVSAKKRVAMNLPGLKKDVLKRGMILTTDPIDLSCSMADAFIFIEEGKDTFDELTRVRISIGTADVIARVKLVEKSQYNVPFEAYCQLRFEHPVPCFTGQKFIVRSYSPLVTIGGGYILDNTRKKRKGFRNVPDYLKMLSEKSKSSRIRGLVSGYGLMEESVLRQKVFLDKNVFQKELDQLEKENFILRFKKKSLVADKKWFKEACDSIIHQVSDYHQTHPRHSGLPVSLIPKDRWFIVDTLSEQQQIEKEAGNIRIPGFTQSLNTLEESQYNNLVKQIHDNGLTPPFLTELEKQIQEKDLLKDLISKGLQEEKLSRVNSEYYLSRENFLRFMSDFEQFGRSHSTFELSDFKDCFGITRKFMIPLLEYLDGEKFTVKGESSRTITGKVYE